MMRADQKMRADESFLSCVFSDTVPVNGLQRIADFLTNVDD